MAPSSINTTENNSNNNVADRGPDKRKIKMRAIDQIALDGSSQLDDDSDYKDSARTSEKDQDDETETDDATIVSGSNSGREAEGDLESNTEAEPSTKVAATASDVPPVNDSDDIETQIKNFLKGWKHDDPGVCCICLENSTTDCNMLVYCDGEECEVVCHQECYGILELPAPDEPWYCDRCLAPPAECVSCALCPNKNGAFRRLREGEQSGSWVHLVCALWMPGMWIGKTNEMTDITVENIEQKNWQKSCCVCPPEMANEGATVHCDAGGCKSYLHVTCAHSMSLLECIEDDPNISDPYFVYCPTHGSQTPARLNEWEKWYRKRDKFLERMRTKDSTARGHKASQDEDIGASLREMFEDCYQGYRMRREKRIASVRRRIAQATSVIHNIMEQRVKNEASVPELDVKIESARQEKSALESYLNMVRESLKYCTRAIYHFPMQLNWAESNSTQHRDTVDQFIDLLSRPVVWEPAAAMIARRIDVDGLDHSMVECLGIAQLPTMSTPISKPKRRGKKKSANTSTSISSNSKRRSRGGSRKKVQEEDITQGIVPIVEETRPKQKSRGGRKKSSPSSSGKRQKKQKRPKQEDHEEETQVQQRSPEESQNEEHKEVVEESVNTNTNTDQQSNREELPSQVESLIETDKKEDLRVLSQKDPPQQQREPQLQGQPDDKSQLHEATPRSSVQELPPPSNQSPSVPIDMEAIPKQRPLVEKTQLIAHQMFNPPHENQFRELYHPIPTLPPPPQPFPNYRFPPVESRQLPPLQPKIQVPPPERFTSIPPLQLSPISNTPQRSMISQQTSPSQQFISPPQFVPQQFIPQPGSPHQQFGTPQQLIHPQMSPQQSVPQQQFIPQGVPRQNFISQQTTPQQIQKLQFVHQHIPKQIIRPPINPPQFIPHSNTQQVLPQQMITQSFAQQPAISPTITPPLHQMPSQLPPTALFQLHQYQPPTASQKRKKPYDMDGSTRDSGDDAGANSDSKVEVDNNKRIKMTKKGIRRASKAGGRPSTPKTEVSEVLPKSEEGSPTQPQPACTVCNLVDIPEKDHISSTYIPPVKARTSSIVSGRDKVHRMVRCYDCERWFHLACMNPPRKTMPTQGFIWQCEQCATKAALKKAAEKDVKNVVAVKKDNTQQAQPQANGNNVENNIRDNVEDSRAKTPEKSDSRHTSSPETPTKGRSNSTLPPQRKWKLRSSLK